MPVPFYLAKSRRQSGVTESKASKTMATLKWTSLLLAFALVLLFASSTYRQTATLNGRGTSHVEEAHHDARAATANDTTPKIASEPEAAPPVLPLARRTIIIDAGHGGDDTGAIRDGINEKDINLQVALKLRDILVSQGAEVILTREADATLTLQDRVDSIIQHAPDMFVSVHTNASESSSTDGIEAYYFSESSRPLAESIFNKVVDGLGERGNWVRQRQLFVVHHDIVPSALIEIGYLSNSTDRELLVTEEHQAKIAGSIAAGILVYFHNIGKDTVTQEEHGQLVHASPAR